MPLLQLVLYRGTLIVLNALVVLSAVLLILYGERVLGERVPIPRILLIAPPIALLALSTPRGNKWALGFAIVANAVLLLACLPFLYFATVNGVPFGVFTCMAIMLFIVPLLTVIGCFARWPRRVAI